MSAGKYRHLVQLQAPTGALGELNQPLDEWETVEPEMWVRIAGLSGREYMAQAGEASEVTHRIELRTYPGLTTRHRFVFGDRKFDIKYVSDIEQRGIEMHVLVREIV